MAVKTQQQLCTEHKMQNFLNSSLYSNCMQM